MLGGLQRKTEILHISTESSSSDETSQVDKGATAGEEEIVARVKGEATTEGAAGVEALLRSDLGRGIVSPVVF